jgi:hypothetical protein
MGSVDASGKRNDGNNLGLITQLEGGEAKKMLERSRKMKRIWNSIHCTISSTIHRTDSNESISENRP